MTKNSSMRFEGSLNVDLNEITMNLVPYPRLHFLISSLSPLYSLLDVKIPPRRMDQMFVDAFSRDFQLVRSDPRHSRYLACGLMVRGNVQISDVNRNIAAIKPSLDMIYWNREGFKVGLCDVPPLFGSSSSPASASASSYSLLCLANNCCLAQNFSEIHSRFSKLYKREFYLHHYLQQMGGDGTDRSLFEQSSENILNLVSEYSHLQRATQPDKVNRITPII